MKKSYVLAVLCMVLNLQTTNAQSVPAAQIQSPVQEQWEAIGLSVYDGSTFEVSKEGQVYRILLNHIGAPVRGQPFAREARQALKEMVYGKKVHITVERESRSGRIIAKARVGKTDINAEMVKQGFAWVYRKHSDDKNLIALEDEARKNKTGLWSDEKPVAPWDYRHQQRALRAEHKQKTEAQTSDKK